MLEEANGVEPTEPLEVRRGAGWKKDSIDPNDFAAHALFGAPRGLANYVSMEDSAGDVRDQADTESCVGQSISKALRIRMAQIGRGEVEFSALSIYTPARQRWRMETGADCIEDDGCFPRDAMFSIRDVGVVAEDVWRFDPWNVNAPLPLDVIAAATRFQVFQWWRIYSSGLQRSDAIAQALEKRYPVVFGMTTWRAFSSWNSSETILAPGLDERGGHMMVIVGFRTRTDGAREFRVMNSWGTSWGDRGFCWIHEDVLASDRCSDFYVMQLS